MNIKILFLDDDQKLKEDSISWELKDKFGEDNVIHITSASEGLGFIKNNLESNLIVLLDIQFPKNEMDGHQLLSEIKDISQLIPVILFSGVDENDESFSDFINNHAFGFISKTATSEEILTKIDEAVSHLKSSLDNTIEDWIIAKEEDKDKPVYFTADGKSYSLNQILTEIRNQTEVGKAFSQRLNQLTIDLLLRNKERLDG